MKISELTNKTFLSNAGAAENSYILINYKDNATNETVTYKTSLDTLSKAIAANLDLVKISDFDSLDRVSAEHEVYSDASINYKPYPLSKAVFMNTSTHTLYYGDGSSYGSDIAKISNNSFIEYDADNETMQYYDIEESEYVPIQQKNLDNHPLVRYNESTETLEYFDSMEEDYMEIATGGTPVEIEVSEETANYMLRFPNGYAAVVDSENVITDLGKPIFVNSSGSLTFGDSNYAYFAFTSSDIYYNFVVMDDSGIVCTMSESGTPHSLGYAMFYNPDTGKMGYYQGSEVVNIN